VVLVTQLYRGFTYYLELVTIDLHGGCSADRDVFEERQRKSMNSIPLSMGFCFGDRG
jgi:hypothetical protein